MLIQLLYYCDLSLLVRFQVGLHYVTQKYFLGIFENPFLNLK